MCKYRVHPRGILCQLKSVTITLFARATYPFSRVIQREAIVTIISVIQSLRKQAKNPPDGFSRGTTTALKPCCHSRAPRGNPPVGCRKVTMSYCHAPPWGIPQASPSECRKLSVPASMLPPHPAVHLPQRTSFRGSEATEESPCWFCRMCDNVLLRPACGIPRGADAPL